MKNILFVGETITSFCVAALLCLLFFFAGAAAQQQYQLAKVACEVISK